MEMKLTNILLSFLICIILFQNVNLKHKKTVPNSDNISIVKIGNNETKTVKVTSDNQSNIKHSTTFRAYMDNEGRNTQRISHNIRIGKDYYISSSLNTRQNSYGKNNIGGDLSITKYW